MSAEHRTRAVLLRVLGGAMAAWLGLACAPAAAAPGTLSTLDVFDTARAVPATPGSGVLPDAVCEFAVVPAQPLLLSEAVERALCLQPRTRQAWTEVRIQAARLGFARAAYLPTLSGTWQYVRTNARTDVADQPQLSSRINAWIRSGGVSMTWLLYDFGGRDAALGEAGALLASSQYQHRAVLQEVFARVAQDYYAVQAAQGALLTGLEVERTAADSVEVSGSRVREGVAPISDQLQAQTQHAQAVVNRVRAEGDLRLARGVLAADLGLDPSVILVVPEAEGEGLVATEFEESVAALIEEARRTHPAVAAARFSWEASLQRIEQARGLPTLTMIGRYSTNNQPTSQGLGIPTFPATGRDAYLGVQVSIPIFEGFGRSYRIREAQARSELERIGIEETVQKVAVEVWSSHGLLQTASANLEHSARLLALAQQSWEASDQRYRSGVGAIIELLNAQATLANAKQQRIQALADWRSSRLRMGAALGRLSGDSLKP